MFTCTPDGRLFYNGCGIGTITLVRTHGRFEEYVVRGRWVEDAEGELMHSTSIASSQAVTEVTDLPVYNLPE